VRVEVRGARHRRHDQADAQGLLVGGVRVRHGPAVLAQQLGQRHAQVGSGRVGAGVTVLLGGDGQSPAGDQQQAEHDIENP
jgi:hypothetical protein